MHPAPAFRTDDPDALLAHLARHPFVTLTAQAGGRLRIAHAPVVVRRPGSGIALDFHLSRSNALAEAMSEGFHAIAVSLTADAYISPDWYESADQVPTWNYVSVEAEGPVAALDEAGLVALLDDLSAQEEAKLAPKPAWTRAKMSDGVFARMIAGIVGARMRVERLEGTTKLSQNKGEADRGGVIAALGEHPVARLMRGEG